MKQLFKITSFVILFAAMLFTANCSSITVLRTQELNRVRDELDSSFAVKLSQLENEISDVYTIVDSIETSMNNLNNDFASFNEQVMNMLRNDRMQIINSLNRLDRQLSYFESRLEESQFHLKEINKQMGTLEGRSLGLFDKVESDSLEQESIKSRELFELAFRDYMTKKFELSYNGFKELIEKHPESIYVDRSLYYLGMISQSKVEHLEAIEYYKKLIDDFPSSTYSKSSYIKVGESYSSIGERDKAVEFYNLVVEKFPESPESRIANERLEALGQ